MSTILFFLCSFCFVCLYIPFFYAEEFVIDKERYEIVSDLKETCGENEYYMLDPGGPFPQCVKIAGVSSCQQLCPPGYKCGVITTTSNGKPTTSTRCLMDETSCAVYHFQGSHTSGTPANGRYRNAKWKPTCLDDGSWAPKQCKGEPANGRCFCYSADGKRLYGHEWSWQAQNMTCACSRKRWELEQVLKDDDPIVSLHCDDWGNYEPLQCSAGSCWCAENKSGKILSKVVPEKMMEHLPCYNETAVGSQYLRQCESHLYGHRKIVSEFKTHGTQYQNFPDIQCQADGSYGRYKIAAGIVSCVAKDNSNLGNWNTQINTTDLPNCNCAYDTKIYADAGQAHTLVCKPNGNYQGMQMINLKYYCVDSDGFVKSDEIKGIGVSVIDCDTTYK